MGIEKEEAGANTYLTQVEATADEWADEFAKENIRMDRADECHDVDENKTVGKTIEAEYSEVMDERIEEEKMTVGLSKFEVKGKEDIEENEGKKDAVDEFDEKAMNNLRVGAELKQCIQIEADGSKVMAEEREEGEANRENIFHEVEV